MIGFYLFLIIFKRNQLTIMSIYPVNSHFSKTICFPLQLLLILKRELLKDLMEQETRKEFNRIRKDRYKGGNKPGKYLAKMLRCNKSLNYIEKMQKGRGEMVNKTDDIATAFQTYYSAMVLNLSSAVTP